MKDENGNLVRNKVVLDCTGEELITEQSHKEEVNINNIVKRHGVDLVQKHVQLLRSDMYRFDDVTGNDFQEAMDKVGKARESFQALPSKVRDQFDNNPAKFLDFVHNPDNLEKMYDMGLAQRPAPEPAPVKVEMVNPPQQSPETPPV